MVARHALHLLDGSEIACLDVTPETNVTCTPSKRQQWRCQLQMRSVPLVPRPRLSPILHSPSILKSLLVNPFFGLSRRCASLSALSCSG